MSLDNLPVEWIISNVGEVLNNTNNLRKPISSKEREKIKGDYPYYGATGKIDALNSYTHDGEYILMGEDGANLLSRVKDQAFVVKGKFWVNNHAHSLQASCGMPSNFFAYYLNQVDLQPFITGSAQPKLTRQNLDSIPMVVVPLAEQQEIVCQLDVMLAQVEQIKAHLDAIPAILKKFRQSVLADAVSGKLLDDEVDSSIYSVKDIFEITSGIAFKKSEYTEDGYKLLQIANVSHGKTKWETLNFVSEQNAKQFDNCVLKSGDVVVALNRPITHDLLKIAKITQQDLPAILYQRVACLRIKDSELIDPEFIFLSMQTTSFRKAIEAKLRGSDQPYLNTSDLGNLTINLIPLGKQKLTLEKVSFLLSKSSQIEMAVQSAQKRVNLLTQSILAKAFSGELTAEWREQHRDLITGVNSAESLLAKIQAEREASKPVKKTRAKKEA